MMIIRDRCRDTPRLCLDIKIQCSDWDPASGLHQGQRSDAPRTQAGQMTATCFDPRRSRNPLQNRSRPQMTGPVLTEFEYEIEGGDLATIHVYVSDDGGPDNPF